MAVVSFMWIFGGMKMGRGHGFSRVRRRLHEWRSTVAILFDSTSTAMTLTDRHTQAFNEVYSAFYFPLLLQDALRSIASAAIDNTSRVYQL